MSKSLYLCLLRHDNCRQWSIECQHILYSVISLHVAMNEEKQLEKRLSEIGDFAKGTLKPTDTQEKQVLPDSSGGFIYCWDVIASFARLAVLSSLINVQFVMIGITQTTTAITILEGIYISASNWLVSLSSLTLSQNNNVEAWQKNSSFYIKYQVHTCTCI